MHHDGRIYAHFGVISHTIETQLKKKGIKRGDLPFFGATYNNAINLAINIYSELQNEK
jgi:hypothetical protein